MVRGLLLAARGRELANGEEILRVHTYPLHHLELFQDLTQIKGPRVDSIVGTRVGDVTIGIEILRDACSPRGADPDIRRRREETSSVERYRGWTRRRLLFNPCDGRH